jgi:hypothetical protein
MSNLINDSDNTKWNIFLDVVEETYQENKLINNVYNDREANLRYNLGNEERKIVLVNYNFSIIELFNFYIESGLRKIKRGYRLNQVKKYLKCKKRIWGYTKPLINFFSTKNFKINKPTSRAKRDYKRKYCCDNFVSSPLFCELDKTNMCFFHKIQNFIKNKEEKINTISDIIDLIVIIISYYHHYFINTKELSKEEEKHLIIFIKKLENYIPIENCEKIDKIFNSNYVMETISF